MTESEASSMSDRQRTEVSEELKQQIIREHYEEQDEFWKNASLHTRTFAEEQCRRNRERMRDD